jgi:hypothetical protein
MIVFVCSIVSAVFLHQFVCFLAPLQQETDEVETPAYLLKKKDMAEAPKSTKKPPVTPDKKKKKGLFGGLFGGKKKKEVSTLSTGRAGSRSRGRKLKGVASVDGSI